MPLVAGGESCLEILADRLRSSPGIVAIEADFRDNTLTVRYQPAQVAPDDLNALADEVGAVFAQRVTYCERRHAEGACEECALRLGRCWASANAAAGSSAIDRGSFETRILGIGS